MVLDVVNYNNPALNLLLYSFITFLFILLHFYTSIDCRPVTYYSIEIYFNYLNDQCI